MAPLPPHPLRPAQVPAAYQQAVKLQQAGKLREAHDLYTAILQTRPQTAEAHWQIGRIARQIGDRHAAVAALSRAHALKPQEPAVLRDYAGALAEAGEAEAAIPVLEALLAKLPDDFGTRSELAIQLQRMGRFDEAEAQLRRCLKAQPANGVLYRLITTGRKIREGEPLIAEMEALDRKKGIDERQHANLHFALAKALEDTGDLPRAWSYLRKGNRALGKINPYSASARDAEVEGLLASFEGMDWQKPGVEPDDGFAPIFITGLARSGTTLAEQIVSAHSSVTPLGEATELAAAIGDATRHMVPEGFAPAARMGPKELLGIRAAYERRLRRRFTFDARFTDKSVSSWHYIGLIRLAIPNARIVVMQRDLRDVLLSMFRNVFAEGAHTYTHRFKDMVHYARSMQRMMDYWHRATPEAFTEISYEALVSAPEEKARALVAAAGLDWEDRCLEYWRQKRSVNTLSLSQARQPVYKSSARAWERYGDDIKPLLEALEEEGLLPDGS